MFARSSEVQKESITVDEQEHRRVWTKDGQEQRASFKYTELFYLHFRYHHAVDDHNNLCHLLPSIEKSWITQYRECNVFSVILAIIKVIALLCICCTKGKENF